VVAGHADITSPCGLVVLLWRLSSQSVRSSLGARARVTRNTHNCTLHSADAMARSSACGAAILQGIAGRVQVMSCYMVGQTAKRPSVATAAWQIVIIPDRRWSL